MDKMREEFEAWALEVHGYSGGVTHCGSYYTSKIDALWEAWQASRAALCVELPDESATFWHQDVCKALDVVGVNHK